MGATWDSVHANITLHLKTGRLYLCMLSAWDIMITDEEIGNKQRRADADNLKAAIDQNCDSFPASLLALVEKWVKGADVQLLLP